jgi:hypothetical protein
MDFRKPKTLLIAPLIAFAASFAVLLIAFIFSAGSSSIGTYGANKTIGWAYQFGDIVTGIAVISFLLYILGYIILWMIQTQVNKTVSIINVCFLLLLPVIWIIEYANYQYLFTFITALE